jgi:hypothetical protein
MNPDETNDSLVSMFYTDEVQSKEILDQSTSSDSLINQIKNQTFIGSQSVYLVGTSVISDPTKQQA